jgi:hypothetical protein
MPQWLKTNVSPDACRDVNAHGMKFFRAGAPRLFTEMMELTERGVVAYPRSVQTK